ncbi:MAG: pyridoxal-phosphate dependent enzyme [Candidatus Melainabacteria bacterium]|nr:pyridoxal-phosphate dependent enzyme [Candidatus Melainabacteria bacterium]
MISKNCGSNDQTSLDIDEVERYCRKTTLIKPLQLCDYLSLDILLASETFQHTGSFKFRAAICAALNSQGKELLAASSGNFGQALAKAAQIVGKPCTIVMPEQASRIKMEAVKSFGANLVLVDTTKETRAQALSKIAAANPDIETISAYDDDRVIAGNSSLGKELAQLDFEKIIVPVGGGGLISGISLGLAKAGHKGTIYGAEPAMANDACRSLKCGVLVANESEPPTLADGARTLSLGQRNFKIIKESVKSILEASEENIRKAVFLLFKYANLKVEPTGALPLAALIQNREHFQSDKPVLLVLSGGNVDPTVYCRIIETEQAN